MPAGLKRAAGLRWSRRNSVDIQHLVYMANQIARNFQAQGEDAAVAGTAQHLRDFWDPRMLGAIEGAAPGLLEPIAAAAVAKLREKP